MTIPQRAIIDAWADLKHEINTNFRGHVVNTAIPFQGLALDDPGLCSALTPPSTFSRTPRAWSWNAKGKAALDVQDLKVTRFEGLSLQPAAFPDATHVNLPIDFSSIELSGRYNLSCLCVQTSFAGEMGRQTESRTGKVTQSISAGTLVYQATVGDTLTLSNVSMRAKSGEVLVPDVKIEADRGGSWTETLVSWMKPNLYMEGNIGLALANLFKTANFSTTMIAELNKRIK